MIYFIIAILFFASLSVGALIIFRTHWLLWFIVPATVAMLLTGYFTYNSILGYPAQKEIDKSYVVSHIIREDEDVIYVWVLPENETVPLNIVMDYNKETAKKLREGMEKTRQSGDRLIMRNSKRHIKGNHEFEIERSEDDSFYKLKE